MMLREIVRFELRYQLRRVQTWLFFAAMGAVAFIAVEPNFLAAAQAGDYLLNSPYVVGANMLIGSVFWLMVGAAVAGEAAARDVATGMHPLIYTAPVRKADYLGGRFLAAFVLNALILLAIPVGTLLGIYAWGAGTELLGPFRPAAYLAAYGFIALPNAFIVAAIQFAFAALSRRTAASYMGGPLLLLVAFMGTLLLKGEAANLLDPVGVIAIPDFMDRWTPIEKNTRLMGLEGWLLANRLLWLAIALGTLAFTHVRFRFAHHTASTWWRRATPRGHAHPPAPAGPVTVPPVRRTFGFATHARQALAIGWQSFGAIAKSWSGLILLALVALLAYLSVGEALTQHGVPLLPRTDYVLHALVYPEIPPAYVIIPLLIVFWSGELTWRERDAGLGALVDAAPVPEWVLFLGKFLGLGIVLAVCMALRMAAGMLAQVGAGYYEFEAGRYLQVLFGLQLADYLFLALLALVAHVVVNQKHIGNLLTFIAFVAVTIAANSGTGHKLLVYGAAPGWTYTDLRGFGPSLGPWLWFKLYWTAWALLLAVVARLLWVRGREVGLRVRLQIARRRFTRPTAATAVAAVGLILTLGGFIFYNTNVLNDYQTAADKMERRAEYEQRYGQYAGIPQPRLTGTSLHVELYPERREAEIRGTYLLVNHSAGPIDSLHLTTAADVVTTGITFDRQAALAQADEEFGYRIYTLETPLQPGDALQVQFEVRVAPRGFRHDEVLPVDAAVVANGTFFTNQAWLPAIGDQAERIAFEAVVGTDEAQVAVAPGALRRTWTEGGRRYFHYVTDAPIGNEYALFSAAYAVHEARWNDVAIQIYHHPEHTANLDRMVRSVQASLSYGTQQFGSYPYSYVRLIERPGHGSGLHAESGTITYAEGFSLWNPAADPRDLDLVFATVAHEVAHQFGARYANREGAGLLSESFAWYAAMGAVNEEYGREHLQRLLSWMRQPEPVSPVRATVPLLQANNEYLSYRKGPFALYALSEYVGAERVNAAFRRLREAHASAAAPRATSLDLYRELQAVTPDSHQSLLHDLFEVNTWWDLETERATAEQTEAGTWRVTLDVRARKVVIDGAGVETPVPMDDWVEIGVFAPAEQGKDPGEPLYVARHRIRSGEQTITVTVPQKPDRAGLDPYHLLDWEMGDQIVDVK
jgi:ABC-2 type transport system permease protein